MQAPAFDAVDLLVDARLDLEPHALRSYAMAEVLKRRPLPQERAKEGKDHVVIEGLDVPRRERVHGVRARRVASDLIERVLVLDVLCEAVPG